MKVRDTLNVIRSWPPVWCEIGKSTRLLKGEVGVLADVYDKPPESAIFMVMRKGADKFTGVLFLRDYALKARVLYLLQTNIGRPIKEIGDLEF